MWNSKFAVRAEDDGKTLECLVSVEGERGEQTNSSSSIVRVLCKSPNLDWGHKTKTVKMQLAVMSLLT